MAEAGDMGSPLKRAGGTGAAAARDARPATSAEALAYKRARPLKRPGGPRSLRDVLHFQSPSLLPRLHGAQRVRRLDSSWEPPRAIGMMWSTSSSTPPSVAGLFPHAQHRNLSRLRDRKSTRLNSSHIPLSRMP